MGQTILTEQQQKLLTAIAEREELKGFYLTGGTALAELHFHHRFSEDLDFFTYEKIDAMALSNCAPMLQGIVGAQSVRFERIHDRYQYFFQLPGEELKVEFAWYPFVNLEPLEKHHGILCNAFRDLAVNKFQALLNRFDPKDFVDMYYILQQKTLSELCADTALKFGITIHPGYLGYELAKVRRIEALPRMIHPLTVAQLKDFFTQEAKKLRDEILGD